MRLQPGKWEKHPHSILLFEKHILGKKLSAKIIKESDTFLSLSSNYLLLKISCSFSSI